MRHPLETVRAFHRRYIGTFRSRMKFPTYSRSAAVRIAGSVDPVRYATMALALRSVENQPISGSIAEVGVWRGATSSFLHALVPKRRLFLFDTFQGFPDANDDRFRGTSVDVVRNAIGDTTNVNFRIGFFPETTAGLESESFAFVLLDVDKYAPTLAGLRFFYPRMSPGGYVFIHDYNSPESERGVSRAVDEFMRDKPESRIEIADTWGSVVFRKC